MGKEKKKKTSLVNRFIKSGFDKKLSKASQEILWRLLEIAETRPGYDTNLEILEQEASIEERSLEFLEKKKEKKESGDSAVKNNMKQQIRNQLFKALSNLKNQGIISSWSQKSETITTALSKSFIENILKIGKNHAQ
jgi:GTPase SAR1 family protein